MVLKTKKKAKEKKAEVLGVPEPVRVSALDLLTKNLHALDRTTFLHRLMYVAEHTFEMAVIPDVFETINNKLHKTYVDEIITGFMLYYPKFLVVMVEGSMYSLSKHIGAIKEWESFMRNIRVLLILPNINQRFTKCWTFYTDVPGTLLEKVPPEINMKTTMSLLANCVKKMYELISCVVQMPEQDELLSLREQTSPSGTTLSSSVLISVPLSLSAIPSSPMGSSNDLMFDKRGSLEKPLDKESIKQAATRTKFLPEYDLLAYLVNSKFLFNFDYLYLAWHTPVDLKQDLDTSWPYPPPVKPINMFEPLYDPPCDLPDNKW
ncbi:uncharacterized protein LOC126265297 [Aethina tumida]|uniref:uncharacterized protein LOC126265297 n=1 Tax=Aethina tumida TaxID=116153 RepID=UPI0021472F78|nr:uncharacterized protein LOC126265297 [Aethina tumida]